MTLDTLIQKLEDLRQKFSGDLEVYEEYDGYLVSFKGPCITAAFPLHTPAVIVNQAQPSQSYNPTILG